MLRLRYTLLTLVGGLILLTVAPVAIVADHNARDAAEKLSDQVLDQGTLRFHQEVERVVGQAAGQCALDLKLIQAGRLGAGDRAALVGHWREVLALQPQLTSLFAGLESTGEAVGVSRLRPDGLSVWQTHRDPATGGLVVREYRAADYPKSPLGPAAPGPDVRTRPWYAAAREAGRPVWTDAYVFAGVEGVRDVLGVTYAVPDRGPGGALRGVLTADFDLNALSRFLAGLEVGREGAAFLAELDPDDSAQVIAHPRPDLLTRPGPGGATELVPTAEFGDGRVRAVLAALPAGDGDVRFAHDGRVYLGSVRRVTGDNRPPWLIGAFIPEDEILAHATHTRHVTALVASAVFAAAILLSIYLSRQVSRPLEALADRALAAGRLRLDAGPRVESIVLEVDQLARAADAMRVGLRSFGKYLPVDLVRGLLDSGQEARLGGERRELTIAFTDIAGFTSTAEGLTSDQLVGHLGDYLAAVSRAVTDSGGTVDKYIGDAVMAFWGAPVPRPDHAAAACVAAVRCQQRLAELRPGWEAAGRPPFHTRYGVHTGEVTVGNIGSPARMNYTVIGDAVNLASRLESLNKHYGTSALVSGETLRAAGGVVAARVVDVVAVAGRGEAVTVYELLGLASEAGAAEAELIGLSADALAAFRARRWDETLTLLDSIHRLRPDDGPARVLAERCRRFLAWPPPDDWDGVNRMAGK